MEYYLDEFEKEVRELVKEHYEKNDVAHQFSHIDEVVSEMYDIAKRINLAKVDMELCILAAYFHDMFCYQDRDTHNELAYKWIMDNEDMLTKKFNLQGGLIELVAEACLKHRSSYPINDDSLTLIDEVLICADKGSPKKIFSYYRRSYLYARNVLGKEHTESIEHAVRHLHEKFGKNGYVAYCKLYHQLYSKDLKYMKHFVEDTYRLYTQAFRFK